jgi:hypothetical protein
MCELDQRTALADQCPQPAEADMRPQGGISRFDPKPKYGDPLTRSPRRRARATSLARPLLTEAEINQALADDPEGNRAEWEAEFRSDLSAFLDEAMIKAVIDHDRPLELPPRTFRYVAFVDPSGGRHDAFTLCIGHKQGDGFFVADVVRGARAPFEDPNAVTREFASLVKEYGVREVIGDNFSAEWVVSDFKDHGIRYKRSERNKSELYLECLPLFMRQAIRIPELPILSRELRLL